MAKFSFVRGVEAVILWAACLASMNVDAQSRLPTIPPGNYTPEQSQAASDFEAARKTPVHSSP